MKVQLIKEYSFEAAHQLPHVPDGHKCRRLHGHSYTIELELAGAIDPHTGWVIDFGTIDEIFAPYFARLDHHCLNEIPGLENPTSEILSGWLWRELRPHVPGLTAVIVWETADARCVYRGE